jgi:hypothetical protein
MKFVKLFEDFSTDVPSRINAIFYGNPTLEKREVAYKPEDKIRDWFIENGEAEKIINEAPKNDSETTKKDLEELLVKTKEVSGDDLSFARYVDIVDNFAQTYVDLLASKGIEITMGDWFRIDSQTEPIVFWLKDKINRPRPYQLAKAYDLPLYWLFHTDACSAAYPSGHATSAFVMSEYFSRKYPEHREEITALGERIANSREQAGFHYPSDTKISRYIADLIFENDLLTM